MVITRTDAELALADIRQTEARGVDARCYRAGGAALILWGVIWTLAYTASGLLPPDDWWYAWIPGNLAGAVGTFLLLRDGRGKNLGKTWVILLAVACFVTALYSTVPLRTQAQYQALPAYILAFLYMALGAARLRRYVAIGAILFAATLFGYFALPHFLAFWMAAIGGGALILGGVWLRSA